MQQRKRKVPDACCKFDTATSDDACPYGVDERGCNTQKCTSDATAKTATAAATAAPAAAASASITAAPAACGLGRWGSWGSCSPKGIQNRTRPVPRCLCQAFGCCPDENGPNAPAEGSDPKNDLDCEDYGTRQCIASRKAGCKLGPWGAWGSCNKGVQKRSRKIPECLCDDTTGGKGACVDDATRECHGTHDNTETDMDWHASGKGDQAEKEHWVGKPLDKDLAPEISKVEKELLKKDGLATTAAQSVSVPTTTAASSATTVAPVVAAPSATTATTTTAAPADDVATSTVTPSVTTAATTTADASTAPPSATAAATDTASTAAPAAATAAAAATSTESEGGENNGMD
jgi:hypothetical protein